MTELLEQAIAAAKRLPAERQDELAELMLSASSASEPYYVSTSEQQAINEGLADAESGRFAADAAVGAILSKHRGA